MAAVDLEPTEFARWRAEGRAHVLLDVRDHDELAQASLPAVLHVPMAQIPHRAAEIPQDRPVVVMCHHGGRSERVARFLAQNGFAEVYNLEGGIDAYARFVDASVGRY